MIKLYNTLSRKKEMLKPLDYARGKKLRLFVCGPTVYDFSHIGHARTYIVFDAFAKFLKQAGFKVFYLQNITDIDDKIIQRAKELLETPKSLAVRFEKEYQKDMKTLGITSVKKYAKATRHIKEIISQVARLLEKDYAYQTEDGIYFDISKFKGYGKLSGRTTEQAQDAVSRIDESVEKRNKGDFALWKISKPGEPSWESPWGKGRPGWHIEDTAIAEKYFGSQYDIHGGAQDLIFPHHEAEISQMEALSAKKPMAKYWMHTGFLTINGEKMSKSLGNFVTIRDFLKNNSSRALRLLILKTHYRSPIDYSENLVEQTKQELERIDEFIDKLKSRMNTKTIANHTNAIREIRVKIREYSRALEDDFNTPKALAAIFEIIKQGNIFISQNLLNRKDAKDIVSFLKEADKILGCIFLKEKTQKIPAEITRLVAMREEYRKQNNWQKADEIRKQIEQKGWQIEDTPRGPQLTFILRRL